MSSEPRKLAGKKRNSLNTNKLTLLLRIRASSDEKTTKKRQQQNTNRFAHGASHLLKKHAQPFARLVLATSPTKPHTKYIFHNLTTTIRLGHASTGNFRLD